VRGNPGIEADPSREFQLRATWAHKDHARANALGRHRQGPIVEPAVGGVVVDALALRPLLQVHAMILAGTRTYV